jgi:hypothetical protein
MENGASSELVRAANDRTRRSLVDMGAEDGAFLCECGNATCVTRIELTLVEYAAQEDGQALLAPGHERVGGG